MWILVTDYPLSSSEWKGGVQKGIGISNIFEKEAGGIDRCICKLWYVKNLFVVALFFVSVSFVVPYCGSLFLHNIFTL